MAQSLRHSKQCVCARRLTDGRCGFGRRQRDYAVYDYVAAWLIMISMAVIQKVLRLKAWLLANRESLLGRLI